MDEAMRQTIYETTSEVFETMFFTFLEPLLEPPAEEEWGSNGGCIEALLSYEGKINGTVRFYFPEQLARQITLNFLALDDSGLDKHQIMDTVGETANMAVGSLLGKLDPGGSCKLAIPQTREIADFSPEAITSEPGLFVFNTEFGLLAMIHQPS